jgi:sorting nexin-9/18/33
MSQETDGKVALLSLQLTADFAQAPDLNISPAHSRYASRKEMSSSSITPRGSPKQETALLPIIPPLVPQTTGEWFPSFRKSLLGGKQFNRFSTFVTSGAEDYLLNGSDSHNATIAPSPHDRDSSTSSAHEDDGFNDGVGEADRHFVDTGPAWRSKVPSFKIMIHSPSKRSSMLSGAYTVYSVTSIFGPDNQDYNYPDIPLPSPVRITVYRRFSHFVALHTALSRRLPGIALPPLPEKQYAGRFNDDFVEARRGDLQRYLSRVVRHPVARYAEVLTFFLGCESDAVSSMLSYLTF